MRTVIGTNAANSGKVIDHIAFGFMLVVALLTMPMPSFAQDSPAQHPTELRELWGKESADAQQAADSADRFRASFETRYSWHPSSQLKPSSEEAKQDAEKVIAAYAHVTEAYPNTDIAARSGIRLAGFYQYLGQTAQALDTAKEVASIYENTQYAPRAAFEVGLLYLQAAHNPTAAMEWFRKVPPSKDGPIGPKDYDERAKLYLAAQLQITRCDLSMGRRDLAQDRFSRLEERYPLYRDTIRRERDVQSKTALHPGPLESLTLKVSVEHKDLLPMEPVQVAISLANETDKPVLARTYFRPYAGGPLQFSFSIGDGPFQEVGPADWPIAEIEAIDAKGTQFAPGWKHTLTAILYYVQTADPDKAEWQRYLLPSPGTCRIKATLQDVDGKKQIESNVLTVEAREPVGEDAQAYAFLKNLQERKDKDARGRPISYSGFLMAWGSPEVEAKQEEFLSRFPNSRYARHLYYTLGRKYSWGKGTGGIQRGLEYLEKAGGYEDFFPAPKALGYLVEACVKQGNLEKARQHLATLQEKFPESISARMAAHRVQQASSDVKRAE